MEDRTDLLHMLREPALLRDRAFLGGEWCPSDAAQPLPSAIPPAAM